MKQDNEESIDISDNVNLKHVYWNTIIGGSLVTLELTSLIP